MERYSENAMSILDELHTERLDYDSEYVPLADAIQALAAYEDAEEQRLLVRFPCKVGDTVKVDVRTWGDTWNYPTIENGKYLIGEIVSITKTRKQTLMKICVNHNVSWRRPMKRYPISSIGKTVFLTREEAEAALCGRKLDGGVEHETD